MGLDLGLGLGLAFGLGIFLNLFPDMLKFYGHQPIPGRTIKYFLTSPQMSLDQIRSLGLKRSDISVIDIEH